MRRWHGMSVVWVGVMAGAASGRVRVCACLVFGGKKRAPIPVSAEMGKSPTLSYEFFDPLNLANEYTFAEYREAELKHGRIAMLASVGMVAPDIWRDALIPNNANLELSPSRHLTFHDVPNGLQAINVVPLAGWCQILFLIGILETQVLVQQNIRDMPGDYGIGYFGSRNKSRHERSLECELENGRLAMIAVLGQVLGELVSGETVPQTWIHIMPWK